MKDFSFFLLKNSFGAKMKRGFCSGDASTSTLNQRKPDDPSVVASPYLNTNAAANPTQAPQTLEDMILQLEVEEELARQAKLHDYNGVAAGRFSCVNNSDILRSARNALNQYPRFSLDGKDAMYKSSFRNFDGLEKDRRKSICGDHGLRQRFCSSEVSDSKMGKSLYLPSTVAGESVIWCKPGVVAKLMGLEAMPVPVRGKNNKARLSSMMKKQNLRRKAERHDMEIVSYDVLRRNRVGSSSRADYCVMKPVVVEQASEGGWPTRRFL